MESWVGTDNLVLCSKWIKCTYSFPKSTKDVISVSISKHSNHCGSRSGLPYYNLTTSSIPHQEGSPYMPPGDILRNSVGLSPDNLHRYSVNEEYLLYSSALHQHTDDNVSHTMSLCRVCMGSNFYIQQNIYKEIKFQKLFPFICAFIYYTFRLKLYKYGF